MTSDAPCPVCRKHSGEGPLVSPVVHADDVVVVTHHPLGPDGRTVPGHLFVEPRRHVARWHQATRDEVDALARAAWCGARLLAARFATEHVFGALVGLGVAHVHQHVLVRHPGTPDDVPWHASASWTGAPVVDAAGLDALVAELAASWVRGCAEEVAGS